MFSFHEVSKEFKTDFWEKPFKALDNVSFNLRAGNIVGFLGANGAGKTTGIKILLGFIKPTSGSIEFDPSLGKKRSDIFKNIGYLPERPYFYADLTGQEFINYIGQLNDLSRSEIEKNGNHWAMSLKIDFALQRKLRFYSKGMLQRLGFVAALVADPKLLILDEPLSGLDPLGRKEFKDIMNLLSGEGKTIFFSSHILSDVEEVSKDVVILESGKLVHSGSLQDLVKGKATKEYELVIDGNFNEKFNKFGNTQKLGEFSKLIFNEKEYLNVIGEISKERVNIESLKKITPTLEDIIYRIGV